MGCLLLVGFPLTNLSCPQSFFLHTDPLETAKSYKFSRKIYRTFSISKSSTLFRLQSKTVNMWQFCTFSFLKTKLLKHREKSCRIVCAAWFNNDNPHYLVFVQSNIDWLGFYYSELAVKFKFNSISKILPFT